MGSSAKNEYCAFTKAVEYLGDRWSLLIVREITMFGPQGFNTLAQGLPGHISRSVLARKLRKLDELGIVARSPAAGERPGPYVLTPAGVQLEPVMRGLWGWAERWVPEDPAIAQRDPDIVVWWLTHRVDTVALPDREVVIDLSLNAPTAPLRAWLVLRRGAAPEVCLEDPLLADERYVYVEATTAELYPISRGLRTWAQAIAERSVQAFGDPALVGAMSTWFLPTDRPMPTRLAGRARRPAIARDAVVSVEA